jgi:ribonucleoside-diphosphate reductase alpha chain
MEHSANTSSITTQKTDSALSSSLNEEDMYVMKRNGRREIVSFDKILKRIKKVGLEANVKINYTSLAMKVIDQLYDGISTTKIDELTAEQCASLGSTHLDYNVLAGRITVSNHHRNTKGSFYQVMKELYHYKDQHNRHYPLVSKTLYDSVLHFGKEKVDSLCDYNRDYLIDYFGLKTLERAYLMRVNRKIVERPQHMWLRVSMGIHDRDWDRVVETYHYMSQKYFTHATPTLFNAGTPNPQLSSCYLMAMEDDSIDGIFNTLKDCALISKWAGGIGLHIHNVRAAGSQIRGTNGTSNGIVPMLKVFNNTAKYVDQCVLPNTWIYTTQGPMEIQDVIAHETEIFNSEGKCEVIHNVLEHPYEGTMIELYSAHFNQPLSITPEHPVYTVEIENKDWTNDIITKKLQNKELVIDFADAKNIAIHDYIAYTIPSYVKDISTITEDDCYMYGLLLGDGHQTSSYLNGYIYNLDEKKMTFVKEYFEKKCVEHFVDNKKNAIKWSKTNVLPFRHSDFACMNEPRIRPAWLHLPETKVLKILQGIMETSLFDVPSFSFRWLSSRLVEDVRYICLRIGVLPTCKNNKSSQLILPKVPLLTDEPDDAKHIMYIRHEDKLLCRVSDIRQSEYHGTLYDLQMSDVHDYMIHNGVVHNGGGKRNGSFAIYLEPWHADVEMFLQMRKNHGDEELKARDLFYALWVPDLFMERVKTGGKWTLMCPNECPGLSDKYGDEFVELYTQYEKDGKGRQTVDARDLWFQILDSQMETGTPYLLFKDAANRKSNQQNLGVIKSSNLCVHPSTMVLTKQGHFPIYALCPDNHPTATTEHYRTVQVWNGREFSEVEVKKTNTDCNFVKVSFSDGSRLKCTVYHKFYIRDGTGNVVTKEAQELVSGDIIDNCKKWPILDSDDMVLNPMVRLDTLYTIGCNDAIANLRMDADKRVQVPVNKEVIYKMAWLCAFIEAHVSLAIKTQCPYVAVPSACVETIEDLKYMLQTCGVNTVIHYYSSMQKTNAVGEWRITLVQLRYLYSIGHIQFPNMKIELSPLSKTEFDSIEMTPIVRVETVTPCEERDDSYCFNEPKEHAGVFNGVRTGQCTEILEYSDENETAVCNLASLALPAFIHDGKFDFEEFHKVTRIVTRNLNKVIDVNFYPTEKTRRSNMRHRPIGLGVQGLADVFFLLKYSFSSPEAKQLNKDIFETMYHAALTESCTISQEDGHYETFVGSPASKGQLQFDMWNVTPTRYDWDALKADIQKHGLRNSLLVAPMPTASTSQILGYNECIEPVTSNIYSRRTLAGEFILCNKYLMREMIKMNLWNETFKNHMVANNGSIQSLEYLDPEIRERYRTVWEIPMRELIDMAADRGAFICQSQSLNLWLEDPNYNTMTSMHFYSWKKGLKTGIYYLRRRPRHQAQQFTIEPEKKEECLMCSA